MGIQTMPAGEINNILHTDNVPIIQHRLGNITVAGKSYGERFNINGVQFSSSSRSCTGSSQIRVENRGEVWVFTGITNWKMTGFRPHGSCYLHILLPSAPLDSLSLTGMIL